MLLKDILLNDYSFFVLAIKSHWSPNKFGTGKALSGKYRCAHFTHMVGILVPSCALPLPLPLVCLSSLTMHCGHFIPAASLPANSALLWQSLCILLSSLWLAYLGFSGYQLSQRKGVIQAWNMSTVPFQEQFFRRPADSDPSLVCYQLQKQRLFFPISAFFPSDF